MFVLNKAVFTTIIAIMLLVNPAISCDYYDASGDGDFTATLSIISTIPASATVVVSVQNSNPSVFCFYEENADLPSCGK